LGIVSAVVANFGKPSDGMIRWPMTKFAQQRKATERSSRAKSALPE
jgi:hypothetical protein